MGHAFKPCPMCGCPVVDIQTPHFADESVPPWRWYWAECEGCGLRTRGQPTAAKAEERWNERDKRHAETPILQPGARKLDLLSPLPSDER